MRTDIGPELHHRAGPTAVDRVALVSDRRFFGELLHTVLPGRGVEVALFRPASTPEELTRSDAVILVDGYVITAELTALVTRCRALGHEVAVIAVQTDHMAPALWVEAGASAVLTDDASLSELREVVDQLARGKGALGVAVREGLLARLRDQRQAEIERLSPFSGLTRREAAVLRELSTGHSPEEIAQLSYVSLNTVRTQIRGVLTKLGVNSVVAAVSMAYRSGWITGQTA